MVIKSEGVMELHGSISQAFFFFDTVYLPICDKDMSMILNSDGCDKMCLYILGLFFANCHYM